MQTVQYWEIVAPDPGACCGGDEVLGRFTEYNEAARALPGIRDILRLRNGFDPERLMEVEIVPRMPVSFGSFVSPLVPGELFQKVLRGASWRARGMFALDFFSIERGPDLVTRVIRKDHEFLYEDKRNRSLERIALILDYARRRLGRNQGPKGIDPIGPEASAWVAD